MHINTVCCFILTLAQAVGHIPLDVEKMNIDLMSISGHKVYGPKGVGALYCRRVNPRVRPTPIIYGGGHERGIRSGTLNVPGIVGLGKAIEIASAEMESETERYRRWNTLMLDTLKDGIGKDNVSLNGHPTDRLPHNLNVYLKGVENKALINYTQFELAISADAAWYYYIGRTFACHNGTWISGRKSILFN